jgi:lipoprotein NlpI
MRRTLRAGMAAALAGLVALSGFARAQTPPTAEAKRVADLTKCAVMADPKTREPACAEAAQNPLLSTDDQALAHFFRAMALLDLNRKDEAQTELVSATTLAPKLWPADWALAEQLDREWKFDQAAASWSAVIAQNPKLSSAYQHRGRALDHAGREADAVADFTQAITFASPVAGKAGLFADRGEALIGTAQLDQARADFDQAAQLDEHESRAYFGRGRIAYLRGDFNASVIALKKVSELLPDFAYAPLWLFLAQSRAGNDGKPELRKWSTGKDLAPWPGALVRLYLGDLTVEKFNALPMPDSRHPADEQCEKSFYLAEFAQIHGHRDQALALLRATVATNVKYFIEYQAAAYELGHMGH